MKRLSIVPIIFLSAVAFAGCDSNESKAIPTTSSTTAQSSTNEVAVIQGYRAFWDDYLAVTKPMTPGNSRIAAHASGEELDALNGIVLAGHARGVEYRGSFDLSPAVVDATATSATVKDCYIDKTGEYSVATGERLDKEDLSPINISAAMSLIEGTWKVTAIDNKSAPCTP